MRAARIKGLIAIEQYNILLLKIAAKEAAFNFIIADLPGKAKAQICGVL